MKKFSTFVGLTIMMAVLTLTLQGCNNDEVVEAPVVPTVTQKTIGWSSLTPSQQQEIITIGEAHQFGGKVEPTPKIDELVSVTYIYDIPCESAPEQTLIEYEYIGVGGKGTNKILLQGHLDGIKDINSVPDVLNNNNCCYKYGGCISPYQCNQTLDSTRRKVKTCIPCRQGDSISPGRRQGDGAVPQAQSTGSNRRISVGW